MTTQIKEVRVDWKEGFANSPTFQVVLNKLPDQNVVRFQRLDNLFYGEDKESGYVRFFCWDEARGQDQGFAGRHFPITLVDGTEIVLKGPWSSRAGVMNKFFQDAACVDVHFEEQEGYPTWGAFSMTKILAWMVKNYDKIDFWMTCETRNDTGEIVYIPCYKDGTLKKGADRKNTTYRLMTA